MMVMIKIFRFHVLIILFFVIAASGCSVNKASFNPDKKYSPKQLQKDYSIFQSMLEESHPGLYWYTSRDSMDYYFSWGAAQIRDSMNESQFKKTLSYVIAKADCGHTTVRESRRLSMYQDTLRGKTFPLSLKLWDDTVVVAANLNRRDTILKRGTVIKKINNKSFQEMIDTFSRYISSDGYNYTHKLQTLSNRGGFGSAYKAIYGIPDRFVINYLDSAGRERNVTIPAYNSARDTFNRSAITRLRPPSSRKERKNRTLESVRNLRIDTAKKTAFMDLNSFGRGYRLRSFFRKSFRKLKRYNTDYMVIDVRGNGGGSVTNSTLISRYLASSPFKIADSLYALNRKSHFGRYLENSFFNYLFIDLMTRKKKDGYYHFGYYERHYFKPKKQNHFDGKVYILTGGNSFSATTLFVHAVIKQDNVFIVGEETGGGAYGNTAWLIPDVTLPETRIKFRLPLFRLVIDKNLPKNGHGIEPEIEVQPTVEAIRKGADYKMDKVMDLINKDKDSSSAHINLKY